MDHLDWDSASMTHQLQIQHQPSGHNLVGRILTCQMSEGEIRLNYELSIVLTWKNGDVICFQDVSCPTMLQMMYKACLIPEVQATHVGPSLRKHIWNYALSLWDSATHFKKPILMSFSILGTCRSSEWFHLAHPLPLLDVRFSELVDERHLDLNSSRWGSLSRINDLWDVFQCSWTFRWIFARYQDTQPSFLERPT